MYTCRERERDQISAYQTITYIGLVMVIWAYSLDILSNNVFTHTIFRAPRLVVHVEVISSTTGGYRLH